MIVLDTHAWMWWTDAPSRLSRRARAAIESADAIGVPTMCCWEFAMLVVRNRIRSEHDVRQWVEQALAQERIEAVPMGHNVAIDAALLEREGFVGDPADRVIYATARSLAAPLVTKDERIRRFDRAATVW